MKIGILGSVKLVMGTMPLSYYENKEGASWYVTCYISMMMITKGHV